MVRVHPRQPKLFGGVSLSNLQLASGCEEEQQTQPPVTRQIAGAAPVASATQATRTPRKWKTNRTSAPALFRKQMGPSRSGEHALRLPPDNMREATVRCVAAVCKTAPTWKHRRCNSCRAYQCVISKQKPEARFTPCSPTAEAAVLKTDSCGCNSRLGDFSFGTLQKCKPS